MNPEDRTEQDVLELARDALTEEGVNPDVRIMASALLSLAAQRDELRGALERAEDDRRTDVNTELRRIEAPLESRYSALESAARRIIDPARYDATENAVLPTIEDRLELLVKVGDQQDNERGADESERTVQRDMHALAQGISALRDALDALTPHPQGTPHDPSEGVQK